MDPARLMLISSFSCHYGTKNLIVLCRNGSILIVQDYKNTFGLPPDQRNRKIFGLTLPSSGPEYWNLAVEGDLAYVTSVSLQG